MARNADELLGKLVHNAIVVPEYRLRILVELARQLAACNIDDALYDNVRALIADDCNML